MLPQRSGAGEQKPIRSANLMGAAPQGVVRKRRRVGEGL